MPTSKQATVLEVAIDVFAADEQKDEPVDAMRWVRLAKDVLGAEGVKGDAELSMLFVDEHAIADLNERFLGEGGPTDVLAFPMDELHDQRDDGDDTDAPPTLLGDVVLCPQVAADQARQAGHSTEDELHLLCAHGVLHLLGYDHGEPQEEREMFGLQTHLLQSWSAARRR